MGHVHYSQPCPGIILGGISRPSMSGSGITMSSPVAVAGFIKNNISMFPVSHVVWHGAVF